MNRISLHRIPGASLLLVVALLSPAALQASSKDGPAKAGRPSAAIYSVPEIAFPQSVFVVPSQPSEGRNPFFPQSATVTVAAVRVTPQNPVESFSFLLNGITSPPKRTAMINGRTFEPGEEGEVRLPNGGKILIKCLEIKADSAVIDVSGQRRELHMRSGF